MEIQLEVKIDSPEYEVDMKTGLDTLQGTSDTIRTIAETILKKRIVQKKFSDSSIRTKMKKTFEGSYGMFFSLYIGPDMEPQYKEVGRSALLELLSFFMHDALHLIPDFTLGNRASKCAN
ncbi:hypothetical protein [Pseudoalteromonas xiamenensis]|uniref:Uncharacterized protein n=1 Tax=Pseudoalteromonas xiamenensis TaxID=882626 RepID=A0A975DI56_9GAMM|nr:hypothetical protein [Pseudoalteromonas xiamenensis]QTH72298.1 hypothetical protein J5O05_05365 [Pseudoalteromonas xiamenensis]